MSKRNTRLRVARIAAAAVIAGGASLTAVGAAQAVTDDSTPRSPISILGPVLQNTINGADSGNTGTPTEEPPTSPTEEPPTSPTEEPPTSPTEEPPTSPTEEPPTSPTEEPPTSPTEEPPTSSGTTNGTTNGNANGGSSSAPSGTNPHGNNNTCTLTGESVDCGNNNTGTDNTQPVPQGDTTSQLAETGSSGTAFLLIGAATLIAGGIGFRLSPRLAANRRNAA